jgi:hypothetical protein
VQSLVPTRRGVLRIKGHLAYYPKTIPFVYFAEVWEIKVVELDPTLTDSLLDYCITNTTRPTWHLVDTFDVSIRSNETTTTFNGDDSALSRFGKVYRVN